MLSALTVHILLQQDIWEDELSPLTKIRRGRLVEMLQFVFQPAAGPLSVLLVIGAARYIGQVVAATADKLLQMSKNGTGIPVDWGKKWLSAKHPHCSQLNLLHRPHACLVWLSFPVKKHRFRFNMLRNVISLLIDYAQSKSTTVSVHCPCNELHVGCWKQIITSTILVQNWSLVADWVLRRAWGMPLQCFKAMVPWPSVFCWYSSIILLWCISLLLWWISR